MKQRQANVTLGPDRPYLIQPSVNDVLSGRGNGSNQHPGNVFFRAIVSTKREQYGQASNYEKTQIVLSIVEQIQKSNPPGRFIKKTSCDGGHYWSLLTTKDVIRKTAQALRERPKNEPIDINPPSVSPCQTPMPTFPVRHPVEKLDKSMDFSNGLEDFGKSTLVLLKDALMESRWSLGQGTNTNVDELNISMNMKFLKLSNPGIGNSESPIQSASPSHVHEAGEIKIDDGDQDEPWSTSTHFDDMGQGFKSDGLTKRSPIQSASHSHVQEAGVVQTTDESAYALSTKLGHTDDIEPWSTSTPFGGMVQGFKSNGLTKRRIPENISKSYEVTKNDKWPHCINGTSNAVCSGKEDGEQWSTFYSSKEIDEDVKSELNSEQWFTTHSPKTSGPTKYHTSEVDEVVCIKHKRNTSATNHIESQSYDDEFTKVKKKLRNDNVTSNSIPIYHFPALDQKASHKTCTDINDASLTSVWSRKGLLSSLQMLSSRSIRKCFNDDEEDVEEEEEENVSLDVSDAESMELNSSCVFDNQQYPRGKTCPNLRDMMSKFRSFSARRNMFDSE